MNAEDNVRKFLSGDADALCALVDSFRKPLYQFILKMIRPEDDADEIFQKVWIKAIKALPQYQERQRFSSWLFKIAHRIVIDYSRIRKPLFSLDATEGTSDLPGTADHATPHHVMADRELGQDIRKAVASLPLQQREVFLLRMESDLSFKEIARIQNTSINTVLARMSYALQKLREKLEPNYKELT